jgi:hypothetical protein
MPTIPIAPDVTITAQLQSIVGAAAAAGYLRVTLCGYGPVVPLVSATCMLADAGVPQQVGSTPLSMKLFGNDVITPAGTFYSISVLDARKNVIQSGMYQFVQIPGPVTIDLSSAAQIVGPYGFQLPGLASALCTGAVPGSAFTAPGTPVAVFYNGIFLPRGQSYPILSYTNAAGAITLNFSAESGDQVYALYIA